jgi:hypothetical protein
MATLWYITKEFLSENNSKLVNDDETGVGRNLHKKYKDTAYEYDSSSKSYVRGEINEEQLQEKENAFVLAQSAWAEWLNNNT